MARSVLHGDEVGTILVTIPASKNKSMNSKIRYMMWPAKNRKQPRTILSFDKKKVAEP